MAVDPVDRPLPMTKENLDAALVRCREFLGPYERDNVYIDFENCSVECVRDLVLLATAYRGGEGQWERTMNVTIEGGVLTEIVNMPEGWSYVLEDSDSDTDPDEGSSCDECGALIEHSGHRSSCSRNTNYTACDECGASIPNDEPEMVNSHHTDFCSLHSANSV